MSQNYDPQFTGLSFCVSITAPKSTFNCHKYFAITECCLMCSPEGENELFGFQNWCLQYRIIYCIYSNTVSALWQTSRKCYQSVILITLQEILSLTNIFYYLMILVDNSKRLMAWPYCDRSMAWHHCEHLDGMATKKCYQSVRLRNFQEMLSLTNIFIIS